MTHAYTVKGITCEGCVAKVKSRLLMHPDITSAGACLGAVFNLPMSTLTIVEDLLMAGMPITMLL